MIVLNTIFTIMAKKIERNNTSDCPEILQKFVLGVCTQFDDYFGFLIFYIT